MAFKKFYETDLTGARLWNDALNLKYPATVNVGSSGEGLTEPAPGSPSNTFNDTTVNTVKPVRIVRAGTSYICKVGGLFRAAAESGTTWRCRRVTYWTRHKFDPATLQDSMVSVPTSWSSSYLDYTSLATYFDQLDTDGLLDLVVLTGTSNGSGDTDGTGGGTYTINGITGLTMPITSPIVVNAWYSVDTTTPSRWSGTSSTWSGSVSIGEQTLIQDLAGRWGSELTLINDLVTAGWKPMLVKVTRGGSREDTEWNTTTPGSPDLATRVCDYITTALNEAGPFNRILWVHVGGENVAGATPGDFLTEMRNLRTRIKALLPGVKIIVNKLHDDWTNPAHSGYRPSFSTIETQQITFCSEDADCYLHDPSALTAGGPEILQESYTNGIHYSGDGLAELGHSFATLATGTIFV